MNAITIAIGVLLAASVAGNALLFDAVGDARERAARADSGRITAVGAAQSCSNYVGTLVDQGKKRTEAAEAAIEAARRLAKGADKSANDELNRAPAVPGDACASAQVETDQWLQKRRGIP